MQLGAIAVIVVFVSTALVFLGIEAVDRVASPVRLPLAITLVVWYKATLAFGPRLFLPIRWSATAAVLLAIVPAVAVAQEPDTEAPGSPATEPNWQVGLSVPGSFVVGDASDFLSDGLGVLGFGGRRARGPLWIRADVSYTWLRGESFMGEQADDALLALGLGPEFEVGWQVLRFYVRGSAGLVTNFQSRRGADLPEETSSAGYFGGGVGFRVRFSRRPRPVALDLGGDVFKTGELLLATLSKAGGTSEQALGMITLHAGLTFGFP